MTRTPETTAALNLKKARSAVAEWRGELARLTDTPAPIVERPSDVAEVGRQTAARAAAIDAARHGLDAARDRLADAHQDGLTHAAARYRKAADEAATAAEEADAELADLRARLDLHIPTPHVFRRAFDSPQWPQTSALAIDHRHTEWLNRRAARCCEIEAAGVRLADHFGSNDVEFIDRFGGDLWRSHGIGWQPEDKTMCAANLPPEVKALYADLDD